MKKTVVLIVGGLALLGAGAAASRSRSNPAAPASRELPAVVAAASDLPAPAAASRTRREADLALEAARIHSELLAAEAGRPDAAQKELMESREREARCKGSRLSEALRADPSAWEDVLDLLIVFEPLEASLRTGRLLQDAVDAAIERRLVETLARGTSSAARRLALAVLGARDSAGMVPSLLAALEDADPRLRADALEALGTLRGRPESPAAGAEVDAALRRLAAAEPDPALRRGEQSLVGDLKAAPPSAPARRASLSGGSVGSRPSPSR